MPATVRLRTLAIVAAVLLALLMGGAALFVQSGFYDVSAIRQHTAPVYQLLDYAMLRSVKARSEGIAVPSLDDPARIRAGAIHYRGHCLQCHGAPGVPPEGLALGLRPAPVNLVSTARHWGPREVFWVVKHGLKMTGMPAWKYRMDDDEIWNIVAFVMAMPRIGPRDYALLASTLPPHAPHRYEARGGPGVLGDVRAGREAIDQYLCATCHRIPGVVGANRDVGPPLDGIGKRKFIAGILQNTPENMVRWLLDPHAFAPHSAMPPLGLTDRDARDIAAYLYTLEAVK